MNTGSVTSSQRGSGLHNRLYIFETEPAFEWNNYSTMLLVKDVPTLK